MWVWTCSRCSRARSRRCAAGIGQLPAAAPTEPDGRRNQPQRSARACRDVPDHLVSDPRGDACGAAAAGVLTAVLVELIRKRGRADPGGRGQGQAGRPPAPPVGAVPGRPRGPAAGPRARDGRATRIPRARPARGALDGPARAVDPLMAPRARRSARDAEAVDRAACLCDLGRLGGRQ